MSYAVSNRSFVLDSEANQYHSWNYATTMRVNLGGHHTETQGVNGELDSGLTFEDVHSAVEEVKEAMGIK